MMCTHKRARDCDCEDTDVSASDAYKVVVDRSLADLLGGGRRMWTIQGPDGHTIGQSWGDRELADDIAEHMSAAYKAGNEQWRKLRQYALHREGCNRTELHGPVSCDCGLAQILSALGDPHYQQEARCPECTSRNVVDMHERWLWRCADCESRFTRYG